MQCFQHEIKVGNTSVPLTCYLPDAAPRTYFKDNRPAVVVLPGGGYGMTYPGEGEPIALAYLARGFCSFVLDYSVYPARFPRALLEALEAIRFVREHAKEYGIDPCKIAICGFSAGGHLAACTGTLWNHTCLSSYLENDRAIYRPDVMILAYPVINVSSHKGSYLNLFSQKEEELTSELENLLNLENQVSSKTPPTFLWHTTTDSTVPSVASLEFAMALAKKKISYEIRIWNGDRHGTGLGTYVTEPKSAPLAPHACAAWVDDSVDFFFKNTQK